MLNEDFSRIFDQGDDFSFRDGMDIGFCVIDRKKPLRICRERFPLCTL
jgi:hypothetical protein